MTTLGERLECERRRLSKAQSILGCLVVALDSAPGDDPDAPDYADVAAVVRCMLAECIDNLDSTRLERAGRSS